MLTQLNSNDDLHWLAFRYVCGELAGAEEEAVERRLADDQLAREVIAEAVELQESIRLAAGPSPHRKRFAVRHRVVWGAAAACLLLCLGMWLALSNIQKNSDHKPGDFSLTKDPPQAEKVALTWVEMQRQSSSGEVVAEGPADEPMSQQPPMPFEEVMSNDTSVPQWLVIAFSDEAKTKGTR